MAQQTAVEYFDEQIQERIIAQDVVARKMIIEISMEDYINIKKQAKQMENEQVEILDEEIAKSMGRYNITDFGQMAAYVTGAKWYREKLKNKQ